MTTDYIDPTTVTEVRIWREPGDPERTYVVDGICEADDRYTEDVWKYATEEEATAHAPEFIRENNIPEGTPIVRRIDLDEVDYTPGEVIESPSGWSYRVEQENGDRVDCWNCGEPLDDNFPIANNSEGFAYHDECLRAYERGE
jgi:hypothetical protein